MEGFLHSCMCASSLRVGYTSVCLPSVVLHMCGSVFVLVCVFYDSECIPFGLHTIYMCALYFFSKRHVSLCMRANFSCMSVLFFHCSVHNIALYVLVVRFVLVWGYEMYFSVLYRRYENRG